MFLAWLSQDFFPRLADLFHNWGTWESIHFSLHNLPNSPPPLFLSLWNQAISLLGFKVYCFYFSFTGKRARLWNLSVGSSSQAEVSQLWPLQVWRKARNEAEMYRPSTKDGRAREEVSFLWRGGIPHSKKKKKVKPKLSELLLSSAGFWSEYQ